MIKMRPLELVRADFAVENFPGGQIALFRLWREPDPHLAVGFGRHLELADLHGNDAGLFAERLLAARSRGLHQIGGCALREPEHLGRQSGIERVADAHQHGHAADDLILFGNPVERARALRLVLQLREARRRARVMRSEQFGVVAAMGEARLGLGQRGGIRRSDEAEHDGALADRLGEDLVVAGKLLDFLAETRESVGLRPVAQRVGRRHAVGLGEDHVEADRRRAAGGKLVDEFGKHGTRPRPLPDPLQRLLVDIDDAHRQSRIESARVEALIGVEDERPQSRDRRRVPDTQRKRSQDDHPHNEDIEETRTHPVACYALWKARRTAQGGRP